MKGLNVIPSVDSLSLAFIANPDRRVSINELEQLLFDKALFDLVSEAAESAKKERSAFVASLTKEEETVFSERALERAFMMSRKLCGLADRVSMSVAYKIMKRGAYRNLGEADTFEEWLLAKLDKLMEDGASAPTTSVKETVFFLEMLRTYEKMGKRDYAQSIFANAVSYGKLVAAIPEMKRKHVNLVSAQIRRDDVVEEIERNKSKLRSKISEERMKGTPAEQLDEMEHLIGQLDDQKQKIVDASKDPIEKLEADFLAVTEAAVEVASSSIPRSNVKSSIPLVAAQKLKERGYNPEEISSDYGSGIEGKVKESSKPVALQFVKSDSAVFAFSVKKRFVALTVKFLEQMFDIHLSSPEEMQDLVDDFLGKE